MNQNGDEKRIQQLFREMSRDDELRTPAFSRVVHGANSRSGATRAGLSRSLALTLATLCVVAITLAIGVLRYQAPVEPISELPPPAIDLPGTPTDITPVTPEVIKPASPRLTVAVSHVRHRKPVNDLALAVKLSSWRSPTDSLLKSSSDDKLMSLPNLSDSLRTLRFYSLDELN
ncbi:MAG TPA: hypothetical protein VN937_04540 [Blastocatellia bacterium]|nr:hypothetical protein [Blastocatellia bacterium]